MVNHSTFLRKYLDNDMLKSLPLPQEIQTETEDRKTKQVVDFVLMPAIKDNKEELGRMSCLQGNRDSGIVCISEFSTFAALRQHCGRYHTRNPLRYPSAMNRRRDEKPIGYEDQQEREEKMINCLICQKNVAAKSWNVSLLLLFSFFLTILLQGPLGRSPRD